MNEHDNTGGSFMGGFLMGSALTAAFVYFFASKRGREHTKRLLDATEHIEDGVSDAFDELLDRHAAPNEPLQLEHSTPGRRLLARGARLLEAISEHFPSVTEESP